MSKTKKELRKILKSDYSRVNLSNLKTWELLQIYTKDKILENIKNRKAVKMANMSYCRFENTYKDLKDCYLNIDNELSESEENYRKKLIKLCKEIAEYCEDEE